MANGDARQLSLSKRKGGKRSRRSSFDDILEKSTPKTNFLRFPMNRLLASALVVLLLCCGPVTGENPSRSSGDFDPCRKFDSLYREEAGAAASPFDTKFEVGAVGKYIHVLGQKILLRCPRVQLGKKRRHSPARIRTGFRRSLPSVHPSSTTTTGTPTGKSGLSSPFLRPTFS